MAARKKECSRATPDGRSRELSEHHCGSWPVSASFRPQVSRTRFELADTAVFTHIPGLFEVLIELPLSFRGFATVCSQLMSDNRFFRRRAFLAHDSMMPQPVFPARIFQEEALSSCLRSRARSRGFRHPDMTARVRPFPECSKTKILQSLGTYLKKEAGLPRAILRSL